MQNQGARSRRHNGVVNAKATLDLIIVDVPKDLHVPTVSNPVDVVPLWNQSADSLLEAIFVFAEDYLQDDGAIIVIHPFQVDAKSTILGYCVEYGYETRKEWLCMNRLHLCSPLNRTLTRTLTVTLTCSLPKSSFCIDALLKCVVLNCLPNV
jgi:tRNA G10  N-methylase Trm11